MESNIDPVSTSSKVGTALVMLGGGQIIKSMRTHGLSHMTICEMLSKQLKSTQPWLALPETQENFIANQKL